MKREPRFTPIDLHTWKRGQIFYYFWKMAPTGYSLTVQLDVTHMLSVLKTVDHVPSCRCERISCAQLFGTLAERSGRI